MRKYARPHLLCWYWYLLHFFRNFFLLCSFTLQASSAASLFSFFPLFDKHQAKKKCVNSCSSSEWGTPPSVLFSTQQQHHGSLCAVQDTERHCVPSNVLWVLTCAYDFVRRLCSYNIQNPSGRKSLTVPSWLSSVFWSLIQPRAV